ncbi:uncharacterized protein V1513DRAFT_429713 [Lipomyces chichibuensis]|uniref:uncharacterized protein n=1 Tax=Lipomyces chichibuensis TaxID=1546026 RepID=UPI003343CD30
MQPLQSFYHRDTSPSCSTCVHDHTYSNTSRQINDGQNSKIKQILRDLKNLEQGQSLEFMLVLVQSDSSQRAEIFTSAALDGHTTSILPTGRSGRLLKLVADYRSAAHSSTRIRRSSTANRAFPVSDSGQDDCELCSPGFTVAAGVVGFKSQCGAWSSLPGRNADEHDMKHVITAPPRTRAPEPLDTGSLKLLAFDSSMKIFSSPTASGDSYNGETAMAGEQAGQGYLSPQSTESSWSSQQTSLISDPPSPNVPIISEHVPLATQSSQKEDFFPSQAQRARPPPLRIQAGDDLPSAQRSDDGHTEYHPLVICDREAVTALLEAKFLQLQQLVCKVVAKAWIKVIEPKKQSNHPYNKGEEFKPDWWPSEARHKEPDHLMKPERLALLVSMLRCRRVDLKQLRGATTECAISIPPEKMEVLEEIYYVAEMEDRYGKSGKRTATEDSAEEGNKATSDDRKQVQGEVEDSPVVVWTIATEKPAKPSQISATAAVRASSRSSNTFASASRISVQPASPAKRSSTEMESNSSDIQVGVESQRQPCISCMPANCIPVPIQKPTEDKLTDLDIHHRYDNHLLTQQNRSTHGVQDLQFQGSVIPRKAESTSPSSLDMFTPRDAHNATSEFQFVYGSRLVPKNCPSVDGRQVPPPSHRRYTTGCLLDLMSDSTADPSSSDVDTALFAFPPRRHSQQIAMPSQPNIYSNAGAAGAGMESTFDNGEDYPAFVHMLSEVVSSLHRANTGQLPASADQRFIPNGEFVGQADISFEADLANMAGYAAGFGELAMSSGVPELGGLG